MIIVKYKTGTGIKEGTYVGKAKGFYYRRLAKPITDINKARIYTNLSYAKRSLNTIRKDENGRWVEVPFEDLYEAIELKVEAKPIETPLFN